jgi:hypothetical protein
MSAIATTANTIESLPQFRNKELVREAQSLLREITSVIKKLNLSFEKQIKMVMKQQDKVDRSRGAVRARNEEKLTQESVKLQELREGLEKAVTYRDEKLTRLQAIEALPEEPVNYEPVEEKKEISVERIEPASVVVRLMSGDLFTVEIDLNDEIRFFPNQFAREAGYNPAAVSRMVFFVDGEEEALIDPEWFQWSAVRCDQVTWKEQFSSISDGLPMLNLIIRPDSEKDRDSKIALIRQILEQKKLNDAIGNTELYSLYSEWNLRYQPLKNSNRYITMSNFIEQNAHLFPILTDEEVVAAKERKKYRLMMADFARFREREIHWMEDHHIYGEIFAQQRQVAIEQLRQFVATSYGDEVVFTSEQHRYFRRWMGVQEIVDMGVRSHNICICPHPETCFISSWERLCAELDVLQQEDRKF